MFFFCNFSEKRIFNRKIVENLRKIIETSEKKSDLFFSFKIIIVFQLLSILCKLNTL